MNDLDRIAGLLPTPCPPPDVLSGYDLCPCGRGGSWPCNITKAAWIAAGLEPGEQVTAQNQVWRRQFSEEDARGDMGWNL